MHQTAENDSETLEFRKESLKQASANFIITEVTRKYCGIIQIESEKLREVKCVLDVKDKGEIKIALKYFIEEGVRK